jgi:hypothetical protein
MPLSFRLENKMELKIKKLEVEIWMEAETEV